MNKYSLVLVMLGVALCVLASQFGRNAFIL